MVCFVSIFFFKKSNNIQVCAYTYPYSVVSSVDVIDDIRIEVLINSKDSFFSNINNISSSYLISDDGMLNLSIKRIDDSADKISYKNIDFYVYNYIFTINFSPSSNYELLLKDVKLGLNFTNGLNSEILIGSFSYYKYLDNKNDITISTLKTISKQDNFDSDFYGFQIGIRNINEEEIIIKNIYLLDTNINSCQVCLIDEIEDISLNAIFHNKLQLNYQNLDTKIMNLEIIRLAFKLEYSNYEYSEGLRSVGLKIVYLIDGIENVYYFEKFTFFQTNYYPIDYSLIIYEYASN